MLSSGLTYEIVHKASGKTAFCGISAAWSYESSSSNISSLSSNIASDMREWLNAASDVIREEMADYSELSRLASWRDLQVQHLHQLGNQLTEQEGCRKCIYAFCSYSSPEFRHHHLSGEWVRKMGEVAKDNRAIMFFMVSTVQC